MFNNRSVTTQTAVRNQFVWIFDRIFPPLLPKPGALRVATPRTSATFHPPPRIPDENLDQYYKSERD